ncbi:hypothetical protein NDU88_003705 [Pleurodeles waltl]|uniref:Uncharacterized protein n=1 Tax=Pleurodeles waltl TaxID=8319 RepID=A0AAV7PCY4_PLEWA|nr:hypothetical protein NDU88_003705 [Pleurodeles waltl]
MQPVPVWPRKAGEQGDSGKSMLLKEAHRAGGQARRRPISQAVTLAPSGPPRAACQTQSYPARANADELGVQFDQAVRMDPVDEAESVQSGEDASSLRADKSAEQQSQSQLIPASTASVVKAVAPKK